MIHHQALRASALVCLIGLLVLSGCGAHSYHPTALNPGGASYIYTLEPAVAEVLKFPAGANGSVAPLATIALPPSIDAQSVATDHAGLIYVGALNDALNTNVILVYAANATGSATPQATLTVPETCNFMSITNASMYCVSLSSGVYQYALTSSGTATLTPSRVIDGSLTQLDSLNVALTLDASGNMYVITQSLTGTATGTVLEFSSTATGNITPSRTLPFTGLGQGLATDSSQNLYVSVVAYDLSTNTITAPGKILVYGSTGQTTHATTTLSGTASSDIGGLQVDSADNLYSLLAVGSASPFSFSLVGLPTAYTGNVAPATSMTSSAFSDPSDNFAAH